MGWHLTAFVRRCWRTRRDRNRARAGRSSGEDDRELHRGEYPFLAHSGHRQLALAGHCLDSRTDDRHAALRRRSAVRGDLPVRGDRHDIGVFGADVVAQHDDDSRLCVLARGAVGVEGERVK